MLSFSFYSSYTRKLNKYYQHVCILPCMIICDSSDCTIFESVVSWVKTLPLLFQVFDQNFACTSCCCTSRQVFNFLCDILVVLQGFLLLLYMFVHDLAILLFAITTKIIFLNQGVFAHVW